MDDDYWRFALNSKQGASVIYQICGRHRRSLGSGFRSLACPAWGMLLLLYSLG